MNRLPARENNVFAVLMALDALVALACTVWALADVLSARPSSSWGWVVFGVAVTSAGTLGAAWFRRQAVQAGRGAA